MEDATSLAKTRVSTKPFTAVLCRRFWLNHRTSATISVFRGLICLAVLIFAGIARAELVGPVVGVLDGDTIDVLVENVTFRRRQHEISKVDRTVFSDVGVASENGK